MKEKTMNAEHFVKLQTFSVILTRKFACTLFSTD
jgi:hypothetical protein